MIAYLDGKLAQLDPTFAVIDCNGVGYLARISLHTHGQIQGRERVRLHTYLQVREDAHVLYGFAQPGEQALFELLLSISGVGGNTALLILSSLPPGELEGVIRRGDLAQLKRVKGIGEKTAARILLELKDKVGAGGEAVPLAGSSDGNARRQEALAALLRLGLPKAEMEKRLDRMLQENPGAGVEQLVRGALRNPS
jgi:Holliday junction DNA helicase RuvA